LGIADSPPLGRSVSVDGRDGGSTRLSSSLPTMRRWSHVGRLPCSAYQHRPRTRGTMMRTSLACQPRILKNICTPSTTSASRCEMLGRSIEFAERNELHTRLDCRNLL
jgi:hypothetical protein